MSIWHHKKLQKLVKPENRITQEEGNTAVEQLILTAPVTSQNLLLRLKREDQNPNGSFKDRGLAFQISHYKQKGVSTLVISSSGNAAISAAAYCKQAGITLQIFLSDSIDKDKLKRLEIVSKHGDVNIRNTQESRVVLHQSSKPKSDAIQFAKENKLHNLRGSTDDTAIDGFETLGYELSGMVDLIDSIFIPCSSGTSTLGMYRGLLEKKVELPQIHIVQTTRVHPIAKEFDKNFGETEKSLADAIVDRVAHRKDEVKEIVESTKGNGWIISDKEILESKKLLEDKGITVSNTAALSVAGIFKAMKNQVNIESPLAIISGL